MPVQYSRLVVIHRAWLWMNAIDDFEGYSPHPKNSHVSPGKFGLTDSINASYFWSVQRSDSWSKRRYSLRNSAHSEVYTEHQAWIKMNDFLTITYVHQVYPKSVNTVAAVALQCLCLGSWPNQYLWKSLTSQRHGRPAKTRLAVKRTRMWEHQHCTLYLKQSDEWGWVGDCGTHPDKGAWKDDGGGHFGQGQACWKIVAKNGSIRKLDDAEFENLPILQILILYSTLLLNVQ